MSHSRFWAAGIATLFVWAVAHQAMADPARHLTLVVTNVELTPPADYTVADYRQLRQQPCSVGDTAEILSGRYAGVFDCVASRDAWRQPFFDDSGIQFDAGSGSTIWKRVFGHNESDPVQLDWYEWLAEGARIDTLVDNMAADMADDNLYLRVPNVNGISTLDWDTCVNVSGDVSNFFILEHPDKDIEIYKRNPPSDSEDRHKTCFIQNDGADNIKIGGNGRRNLRLTWVGPAEAAAPQVEPSGTGGNSCRQSSTNICEAFSFYGCGESGPGRAYNKVEFRAHLKQPFGAGVGVRDQGCSSDVFWTKAEFAGTWEGNIHVDNPVWTEVDSVVQQDPWGRRFGWDGSAYPSNNSGGYKTGGTGRVQSGNKLTGEMVMQYGGKFFHASMSQIGNSVDDPFVVHFRDMCFSGPNTTRPNERYSTSGTNGNVYKVDDLGNSGRYWFKFTMDGDRFGNGCSDTFFDLEATKNGRASNVGVTIVADGLRPFNSGGTVIDTAILQGCPGDVSRGHTIVGGSTPNRGTIRLIDSNTIHSGTFEHLLVEDEACAATGTAPARDNVIRDLSLSGRVTLSGTVEGTVLDNVTFTGGSRQVVSVGGSSDLSIGSGKVSAPVGSSIEGSGSLTCGGSSRSLPFVFDGVEDACEKSASTTDPPPTLTLTSPNGGESWDAGSTHAITWSDNISENVKIDLVQGTSVSTIVSSTASDGSYNWSIPANQSGASNYRVRITSTSSANVNDESNGTFSIVEAPPPPPTSVEQDVELGSGWNLMSLNVEPDDPKVESVVADIESDMILLKDNDGRLYYPELGINTIGSWDVHEGYQINVIQPTTLTVGGPAAIDPSMPIELEEGWNLVPYILATDQAVAAALSSITDYLVIVINNVGDVFYPELGIDEIGMLRSGQGYRIYVNQASTLVFGNPG